MHAHHAALEPDSGRRARRPRIRRLQSRHRLRVRFRVGAAPLMYPFASLPENLAAFCEALRRDHGFRIGPGELHDAARALDVVDLADERAVRHALRPVLSGTLDDVTVFDAAFTHFFLPAARWRRRSRIAADARERDAGVPARDAGSGAPSCRPIASRRRRMGRPPDASPTTPLESADADRRGGRPRAVELQPARRRRSTRPSCRASSDCGAMRRAAFVRRLHLGLSRRWRPARRGRRFDLRRTLRASLQTGGETLSPRWLRASQVAAPRFVLLVDGSRSMRRTRTPRCGWRSRWRAPRGTSRSSRSRRSSSGSRTTCGARRPASVAACRLDCIMRGAAEQASARASVSSCGGSASARWAATPS